MNRSILIVICDFLLISLLAFSSVDINKVGQEGKAQAMKFEIATNQVETGKDLAAVMKLALDEERKGRDQLMSELQRTRSTATEREKQIQTFQEQLQTREQLAQRLQQEQASLQEKFAAAQTNIETLNQRLQNTSGEALLSREKLAAMEAEARKRAEEAAALQQQLNQLSQSNQLAVAEKQRLAGALQVAEVEKRHATEQAVQMAEQVKVEREEKAKLAEGVKVLANKSSQLAEEIRENRPLAPNAIYNDFLSNRVEAAITASRSGIFGNETSRRKQAWTVLATNGTNTFALFHVQDTPLTLLTPGTEWEGLAGSLDHGVSQLPVHSLSFHLHDPRMVWIPVAPGDAEKLGCKIFRTSSDPYKFQDAVLVGAQDGYYGECRFEIDASEPEYVKLDNSFLKGLFGKFNPSRGDLVFSKTGELLGIMVNSTYCMMIQRFDAAATFRFGNDVRAQHTGEMLSLLYMQVTQLPFKLQ